jgi:DNA (cytosine-5)-methyltransferase 1
MNERIAIDIFSGAGGLSLGAEWAGIKSILAVELDPFSAKTYQKNHPKTHVLNDDIKDVSPLEFTNKHPFILFGGPPCQGFSWANTKTRNMDNNKNALFNEFLRFVEILEPEWVLFENVQGFKSFNKGLISQEVITNLEKLGYQINADTLCALDYGVPQKRCRYFIIGHRTDKGGIKFDFNQIARKESLTVWDAISDLPLLNNGDKKDSENYRDDIKNEFVALMRKDSDTATQNFLSHHADYVIERYKGIKPGENWRAIEHQLSTYTSTHHVHSGIYRRLSPDEPSCTIANYRKSMLIHPYEDRGLSLREAARLQSFPDHYQFYGKIGSMQQQVGNAVPPLLAKASVIK